MTHQRLLLCCAIKKDPNQLPASANYERIRHVPETNPPLSSDPVQEKKAARRKLLDEVFQRRTKIYQRFLEKKRRLQENNDLATIA